MNNRRPDTPRSGTPGKGSARAATRDHAFASASRLTRWIVAGAVGLTAAFPAAAAVAFSGHSTTPTDVAPAPTGTGSTASDKVAVPPTEPGQISAPQAPPISAGGGGQAVSGGS
jgi:hypothetical protein